MHHHPRSRRCLFGDDGPAVERRIFERLGNPERKIARCLAGHLPDSRRRQRRATLNRQAADVALSIKVQRQGVSRAITILAVVSDACSIGSMNPRPIPFPKITLDWPTAAIAVQVSGSTPTE